MPKAKNDVQDMRINDPQQNISVKMTFYFNILKLSHFELFLRITFYIYIYNQEPPKRKTRPPSLPPPPPSEVEGVRIVVISFRNITKNEEINIFKRKSCQRSRKVRNEPHNVNRAILTAPII